MRDPISIELNKIETGARMRPSTDTKVTALALSISGSADAGIGFDGLRLPVEVRKSKREGEYVLVSGLNRLRAMEMLERTEIAAFVLDVDAIRAERLELEENLVRADLTALDRAFFVKRFREIFEAEHGEVKAGRPAEDNTGNLPVFSDAVVERLDMSVDMCRRALRIANGLHSDVPSMLRGLDWDDNQKALLELAGVPPEKQVDVVNILLDEEVAAASMREAIAMLDGAPVQGAKDEALKKWYGVVNLRKPEQMRVAREWMAKRPDVFEEVLAERGYEVVLKAK